jgi:hypothetical protein
MFLLETDRKKYMKNKYLELNMYEYFLSLQNQKLQSFQKTSYFFNAFKFQRNIQSWPSFEHFLL